MLGGKQKPVPGPTYMSNTQKSEYLRDLRTPNFSRPSGSRPPPPSKFASSPQVGSGTTIPTGPSSDRPTPHSSNSAPNVTFRASNYAHTTSTPSANIQTAGRPLVRPPSTTPLEGEEPSPTKEEPVKRKPSMSYIERGTRWMEKQEARSLRMALEDMDQDEEQRLYSAAQDEAAELVWKHQNPDEASALPGAPFPNPDLRRDYHAHLRKGSYQRSQIQDAMEIAPERKVSGGSHEECIDSSTASSKRRSMEVLRKVSPPAAEVVVVEKRRTPSGKSYGGLAEAVADDIAKAHRRSSSGSRRLASGEKKKMYMHANDRIWEDPHGEEQSQAQPQNVDHSHPITGTQPTQVRKNPFARVRMQAEKLERSRSEPLSNATMHDRVEIQRNSPTQSRRAWYMSNEPLSPTTASDNPAADEVAPKTTPTKDGREIRDDDIRAATSKKRNDYSAKLPRPTIVSNKPERPIVSFQNPKPNEVVLEGVQAARLSDTEVEPSKTRQPTRPSNVLPSKDSGPNVTAVPQIKADTPRAPVPTINVPDEPSIPSIVLPDEPDFAKPSKGRSAAFEPPNTNTQPPEITVKRSEEPLADNMPFAQPWPSATERPLPRHAATSPIPHSRTQYTTNTRPSGTLCAQCALPIAGRILSAGGQRFHPSCFVCHQCHTNLELVAFYPEPEKARAARLSRIETRKSGAAIPIDDLLQQEVEDGDGSLRFFCHLDFHELFSPRCKSCKTPIEGEVVVACGAEWHPGHFFCAQCGDPFDSATPFVEKDGYAWCVRCHTNRYSSKCRKCKKPVTDTVVRALGYEWHTTCFVCTECNGEFDDGRYFLRGASQDPVCVKCQERRLKV